MIPTQEHGATIVDLENGAASNGGADGLYTTSYTPVGVVTVDCIPMLVTNRHGEFAMALHGGWRGLRQGIVQNAFCLLCQRHRLDELVITMGPFIRPYCYEVDENFIQHVRTSDKSVFSASLAERASIRPEPLIFPASEPALPSLKQSLWFDLSLYAALQFQSKGISAGQLSISRICTYCTSPAYASARRRKARSESKAFQYAWIARRPSSAG